MEIYSGGGAPYPDINSDQVASHVKSGMRMKRVDHLPEELYDGVVTPCWNINPSERPTLEQITLKLAEFHNGGEGGPEARGYYAPNSSEELEAGGYYDPNLAQRKEYPVQLYDDVR